MKYEFDVQHAYDFARHVGIETKTENGNLHFRICPYCKGGTNGKPDTKTFAIDLKTGQFKCLRSKCGVSGNMITLSKDFDFSLGKEIDEYYAPKKQYKRLPKIKTAIVPKNEAVKYLGSRGISEEVAKKFQITVQNGSNNILAFPFIDEKGILQFVKYRKTDFDKAKDKNKEWCESNCKPILFGMYQCNPDNKTLIITEGQIDSLSVSECGFENAVSVPTGAKGFTWIPYCWDFVCNFETLIVFGDYENDKITLLDELSKRFKKLKIKHVRKEDYKDCKDANDILRKYGKEQIKKCITNAVDIPIVRVINLADVENVDVFKIPKVKTGIKQVDRLLYGGLPLGGLTLITGKTGEGKSTLASQILVNAIHQKYKCFAYSGELTNFHFKNIFDFQVAGRKSIIEYRNSWGDLAYNLSDSNRKDISNWYHNYIKIYDNSVLDDDVIEQDNLLNIVEEVILRDDTKVVLLDNLMTAISLENIVSNDKYDRQCKFINKLSKIANEYNALIILVAHKRKNNFSIDENDEINGASEIANYASVILSYGKNKDINENQRLCKITKNRLFGKLALKGFTMDFCEKSRRIYGIGDDIDIDFGWKTVFEQLEINQETPFN